LLSRTRNQRLSKDRPAEFVDLGCGCPRLEPAVSRRWCRRTDSIDPRLHRLRLLGFPRKGGYGSRIPLIIYSENGLSRVYHWQSLRRRICPTFETFSRGGLS